MANDPVQTNADAANTAIPPEKVKVESGKAVDPQYIVKLVTTDGGNFNAKISIDLTVRNVDDKRVYGHAETIDIVRKSEITIPINFNDAIEDWNRVCEMEGAQLGYGFSLTLISENGTSQSRWVSGYMSPTNDPPMTSDEVVNHYQNDPAPAVARSLEEPVLAEASSTGSSFQKAMPHFMNGFKALFGQG
ncbi:hypothetical protein [Lewinella cohaerens]|uniref:hypothetical protein n=1 Tax=Lewinella cohaerens TaxID=70995 RepID=UPI0003671477|nr:hypothetical protein [Lewinella cohaerens]